MTTQLQNEFRGVAYVDSTLENVGNTPVDPNMNPDLQQVLDPQDPIIVAERQPMTIECNEISLAEQADRTGYGLQHPPIEPGGSWLSDMVGMACDKLSQSPQEIAPALTQKAPAPQAPQIPENTHYTREAQANFDMKMSPSGMSA